MAKYTVEYFTNIYATITVDAGSEDEAEELAEAKMIRWPLAVELVDGSPVDLDSGRYDGKAWQINIITDEHGNGDYR